MKFIAPDQWRLTLLLYAVAGLALGLCNRPLNLLAQHIGIRPGLGTALNVNILMTAAVACIACSYPRLWTSWLGALVATGMFYLGMRLVQSPNVATWTAKGTLFGVHPILVAACIGYGAVGSLAALAVRPYRTVGLHDAAVRCTACGYLLVGLSNTTCPECGKGFDAGEVARQAKLIKPAAGDGRQS